MGGRACKCFEKEEYDVRSHKIKNRKPEAVDGQKPQQDEIDDHESQQSTQCKDEVDDQESQQFQEMNDEVDDDAGFYLSCGFENNGTMFKEWSDAPILDALAYYKPTVRVADWKKRKSEIKRGVGEERHPAYRQSVALFIKEAKAHRGHLIVSSNAKFVVALRRTSNQVLLAKPNEAYSLEDCEQVAVVDRNSMGFNVLTFTSDQFRTTARNEGAEASNI